MSKYNERNAALCNAYANGESMTSISKRSGISCTQLSRIFTTAKVTRNKFELDISYFEANKGKSKRQMSVETGLPIRRVSHLFKIAYGKVKKDSTSRTDFSARQPQVDHNLIDDRDWLYDQYVTKKLGTPSIAKLLAIKSSAVIRKLKEFGIQLRTMGSANQLLRLRYPDHAWLQEHYVVQKWSISKCADHFNIAFDVIYTLLNEFGITPRSASEQHLGELNEFFGNEHSPEIVEYCKSVGAKHGSAYWLIGDVDQKVAEVTARAKEFWSDPVKRSEQSARITKLCQAGQCNAKQITFIRARDSKSFLFRSSWEYAIAVFLEECQEIIDWDFEELAIPYLWEGKLSNFIIDFTVHWKDGLTTYIECKNKHLLSQPKEIAKIEAAKVFLNSMRSNLVVVSDIDDLRSVVPSINWITDIRYTVDRSYLKSPDVQLEVMRHAMTKSLMGWRPPTYTNDELIDDIRRLKSERIDPYSKPWRSTSPTSGKMPGRALLLHHQPHFLTVGVNGQLSISEAFNNPWVIYRSILQSMMEKESLSYERLLREINFHFGQYGRTSHFAPGFARAIIKHFGMSGKRIFDPCCGWGGRLIGSWLENCHYSGCELSPLTINGLNKINEFIGFDVNIVNQSCLNMDWPKCDFTFTSPPFYNVEQYVGGDQPWQNCKSREQWVSEFIKPFIDKVYGLTVLYLDAATKLDYESVRQFDDVIEIKNRRHARHKSGSEWLCVYK